MPSEAPRFESVPVFDSIPEKNGSHAPALCHLPDGALIAAWYSYRGPGELDGAEIFSSRRIASNSTWSVPARLFASPTPVGNPVLYADQDQVWLFYAAAPAGWGSARVQLRTSGDNGGTWSTARDLQLGLGTNVRFPPVRLANGDLLLPAYNELVQRSEFFFATGNDAYQLRSTVVTPIPHQNLQPSVVVREDGSLLAALRNQGQGDLLAAESLDAGIHWSAVHVTGFPNPNSPAELIRLNDRGLVLIFNDSSTLRTPLSATYSDDDGRRWSRPRVLVEGDGQFAYPTGIADPDGTVHVVYSHNRERIQYLRFNLAWLLQSDQLVNTGR